MLLEKDQTLIGLLKVNARESVASLARKMGVSRSTVQDRITRLEENGVIAGYQVKLSVENRGGITAHVQITIEPAKMAAILGELKAISNIEMLHTVSGRYDLVAFVRADSTEKIDQVLDQIGFIRGVIATSSAIILSTKLDRR